MSSKADLVFRLVMAQILVEVSPLKDADYIDVLEEVVEECRVRIQAKKQEGTA